jgi:hypothetical protein
MSSLWNFVKTIEDLKASDRHIGIIKEIRNTFDLGLRESKLLSDEIMANKLSAKEIYQHYSKGVLLKKCTLKFFKEAVTELIKRKEYGTLSRLLAIHYGEPYVSDNVRSLINTLETNKIDVSTLYIPGRAMTNVRYNKVESLVKL